MPASHRRECHFIGSEAMYLPPGVAQCGPRPIRLSVVATNPERHDGAAVIQVESDPIPAIRLAIEVLTGPLVIEPGLAADDIAPRRARNAAAHAQVRLAVVIAGRLWRRTLLAVARDTVEERWLCNLEAQIQGEILRRDMSLVPRTAALELPVIDPDAGVPESRVRESQAGASDALILPQVAARRIADGAVGDQQLTRGKCAGIPLRQRLPRAAKRDLKTEPLVLAGRKPTGQITPFDPKPRMAAVITRKFERVARDDRGQRRGRLRRLGDGGRSAQRI